MAPASAVRRRIYRHPAPVRLAHWAGALALGVLAMSGMQIFNAHPALYASDASTFERPVLSLGSAQDAGGNPIGYVQLGRHFRINTTHVLGFGPDGMGGETPRGFPSWATIPAFQDLAGGRRWHIFFAWLLILCGLAYARWSLRLWPGLQDLRALPATLRAHLPPWRVKAARRLNPLQKTSYFGIVFVLVPLMIVSGLALSPSADAWVPWLPALLGGRQFARLWHFAGMFALLAFFVVHLLMVALTGLRNNMRSMISGWYVVEDEP